MCYRSNREGMWFCSSRRSCSTTASKKWGITPLKNLTQNCSKRFQKNKMKGRRSVKLLRKVRIKNSLGLHARPATVIVKLLQGTASDVSFTYRKATINEKR